MGDTYKTCARCPEAPGQLVRFFEDGHEEALCFTCWRPLTFTGGGVSQVKLLNWINKYGKLQP